jgi:hypothetical protein
MEMKYVCGCFILLFIVFLLHEIIIIVEHAEDFEQRL